MSSLIISEDPQHVSIRESGLDSPAAVVGAILIHARPLFRG